MGSRIIGDWSLDESPISTETSESSNFWQFLGSLPGWWYTHPSEKYEFVNWDDDIPNGKIQVMFQENHQPVTEDLLFVRHDLEPPSSPLAAHRRRRSWAFADQASVSQLPGHHYAQDQKFSELALLSGKLPYGR